MLCLALLTLSVPAPLPPLSPLSPLSMFMQQSTTAATSQNFNSALLAKLTGNFYLTGLSNLNVKGCGSCAPPLVVVASCTMFTDTVCGEAPSATTVTFAGIESGFCVKADGSDENSGVVKLAEGDHQTDAKKQECLNKCAAYAGATGCEVIWNQDNRGCYVHTSTVITRGNGAGNHNCWISAPLKVAVLFAPMDNGFCVKADGVDENSGVVKLAEGDHQTDAKKKECAAKCAAYAGATGCEVIWGQDNRGCYVHTSTAIARGNNVANHNCWVSVALRAPGYFKGKENGFCVKSDGSDENAGVTQLTSEDTDTAEKQAACIAKCSQFPNFTGCEAIWNQGNRGCYVHTSTVITRGNGVGNHACWIKQ
eukprot:c6803_g1_i1.p1 GENE.c6803_g1_i1~~c6803_g1_i1.p1  ORF type:complete len:366 (+),score=69.25 c6803_g1_i1:37-1134(+)